MAHAARAKKYNSTPSTFILELHVIFVWLQYRHPSNQYRMRCWLKVQAGIWPVGRLESLHPPSLGSKRAVVNAHQEMYWGWPVFTEIKVESTDVKLAIGVAISQWLHSSMCFVSEGNNNIRICTWKPALSSLRFNKSLSSFFCVAEFSDIYL